MKKIFVLIISLLVFGCDLGAKGKDRNFEEIQSFLEKKGMVKVKDLTNFSQESFLSYEDSGSGFFTLKLMERDELKLNEELVDYDYILKPFIFVNTDHLFKGDARIGWLNFSKDSPLLVVALFPKKSSFNNHLNPNLLMFQYFDKEKFYDEEFFLPLEGLDLDTDSDFGVAIGGKDLAISFQSLLGSPLKIAYEINFPNPKVGQVITEEDVRKIFTISNQKLMNAILLSFKTRGYPKDSLEKMSELFNASNLFKGTGYLPLAFEHFDALVDSDPKKYSQLINMIKKLEAHKELSASDIALVNTFFEERGVKDFKNLLPQMQKENSLTTESFVMFIINSIYSSSLLISVKLSFINWGELPPENRQLLQDTIKVYLELLKYVGK